MASPAEPRGRWRWRDAALVLVACVLFYWLYLGYSGFSLSEGFRVVPAWEMLDNGDWLVTRMFEQPYLRKPPGMPWAIAGASLLLGRTEFAARSVSALATTLCALLSWGAASRWWGRRAGLCAGLGYALTPLFWMPGRSAEIEALHNVTFLLSALALLRVLQPGPTRFTGVLLALATGSMALVKGPSGIPALVGLLSASLLVQRSWRPLLRPGLWLGFTGGLAIVGIWLGLLTAAVSRQSLAVVTEPASRFLWKPGFELQVLTLPVSALASALPLSLSLLPALLRVPSADEHAARTSRADDAGRTLAWSVLLSLALYCVIGVSNARYAMPALTLVPMVFGFTVSRAAIITAAAHTFISRVLLLHRPAITLAVLALGAAGHAIWFEQRRETRTSGRAAGLALGDVLRTGEVWADEMIDARPEVLLYAQRQAEARGVMLRVRWMPGLGDTLLLPPPGGYLVLRDDDRPREWRQPEFPPYQAADLLKGLQPVFAGQAHNFTFKVYQIP